jgi:putative glutathione S-transferase
VNDVKFVRDLYEMVDKTPRAFSVPVLWDKKRLIIVSDDSAGILRALDSGFRDLVPSNVALFPKELIEAANGGLVQQATSGYFKSRVMADGAVAHEELKKAFAAVAEADRLLGTQRFLVGSTITEADVRLFHTLVRMDVGTARAVS